MWTWFRVIPAGLLVALVAGGCVRHVDEELPSGPNKPEAPAPAPSLTPITPVPVGPAPVPAPTPSDGGTPSPGATPTPQATPPPSASGCRLPRGTGSGENCPRVSPVFLGDVQGAIKQLIQEQPKIFVKRGCEDCYDVTDPGAYLSGVVGQLARRGYCAIYDGEELAVKNTNDFNEQYDILSSSNSVRSGGESYRSTCRPAWF
jgi:hypothetical protein